MPSCLRSSAVLEVADIVRSRDFYLQKLGFGGGRLWGEPPCFSIVGRDAVTVMLDRRRGEGSPPINQYWAVYIYVDDVDAMAAELRGRGIELIRGPEDMPHGCREIDIKDPDGHIIAFGQDLDPAPEGPGL